jgi:hypothetical protein
MKCDSARCAGERKPVRRERAMGDQKKHRHFVLCPTCQSKSKKLSSEMGGLQTRRCQRGHLFEVDMFFGIEINKRRVEHTERPWFSPTGGSYNDWVYGKYRDDPEGKQDR